MLRYGVPFVLLFTFPRAGADGEAIKATGVTDLVICCMDYRCRALVHAWVERNLHKADLVALAGAGKAVTDRTTGKTIFEQIRLAEKFHSIKKIHIIDHLDCAAYGGSRRFLTPKEEEAAHARELRKAAGVIREQFPHLEIHVYLQRLDQQSIDEVHIK